MIIRLEQGSLQSPHTFNRKISLLDRSLFGNTWFFRWVMKSFNSNLGRVNDGEQASWAYIISSILSAFQCSLNFVQLFITWSGSPRPSDTQYRNNSLLLILSVQPAIWGSSFCPLRFLAYVFHPWAISRTMRLTRLVWQSCKRHLLPPLNSIFAF